MTVDAAADFGTVYIGQTGTLSPALTLKNSGNLGTNVAVSPAVSAPGGTTAGYPQYTFNGNTNTAFSTALASNASVPVNGIFAPGPNVPDAVASSVKSSFALDSSPLCAVGPSAVVIAGAGTAAVASFSPGSLKFQDVPCGTTAAPKTITFSNTGNVSYTITSLALNGTTFSAYIGSPGTTTGTVPAAIINGGTTPGTLAVTVAPTAVPQAVDNPGATTYSDVLTVTYQTGAGPSTTTFPITENPFGAVIAPLYQSLPGGVTLPPPFAGLSPLNLFWFGSAQQNLLAPGHPAAIAIANTGNATGSVLLAFASGQIGPFNFNAAPTAVPPGGINNFTAWSQPVSPTNPLNSAFANAGQFTVTGPNCGQASFTGVTLAGQVVDAAQITASPTTIGFGSESCGTSQSALNDQGQTITLTNTAPYVYTWHASLPGSATINGVPAFTLSSTSGSISAGGGAQGAQTGTFTVTPNAAALVAAVTPLSKPSNYFSTTITVTFTSSDSNASPQNSIAVPVSVTPQGAVLDWPQSNYTIAVPRSDSANILVSNSGNQAGNYTLTITQGNPARYSFGVSGATQSTSSGSANAQTSASVPVFNSTNILIGTPTSATVALTSPSGVLCAPLPTSPATLATP